MSIRRLAEYREPVYSRLHLFVNAGDINPVRLAELAGQADVVLTKLTEPDRALGVYEAIIDDDLLGAERLRDLLQRSGVDAFVRHERIVSAQDVRAAPLAVLEIDRAERGCGGPRYGTQFVFDRACPKCGTGARPAGDVFLRASDVPRRGHVFRTYDGEMFFSDRARNRLDSEGVTGVEWHQVRTARSRALLSWAQLVAPTELPSADAETSGGLVRENACRLCKRDGYFHSAHEPLELRYTLEPTILDSLPDVVSTREHFGVSRLVEPFRDSVFAQPLICVKPRVVELLTELLAGGTLKFVPVAFGLTGRPDGL